MTTITTSTTATATGAGPGRRIDRCQNGILWSVAYTNASQSTFSYSTDNGATWTGSVVNGIGNPSLFIDLDDYAHVVWVQSGTSGPNGATLTSGALYYMRGTPNAGRTAWTWGTAQQIVSNTLYNYPDVVAFRTPGVGGSWDVAIVASLVNGSTNYPFYVRYRTDGTTFTGYRDGLPSDGGIYGGNLAFSYGLGYHTYPSIDFNHIGDGKTVAGSTPHLYVGWSAGASGAGKGIRFRKAVYSGGAWTWNTEREIDNTRYNGTVSGAWMVTHFDGTRACILGMFSDASFNPDIVLYDRDASDTTTTSTVLLNDAALTDLLRWGSGSYDGAGNVYLFGRDDTGANGTRKLNYRKWTRSSATLGPVVTIDTTGPDSPYLSAKRSYSGSRIEAIYTDYAAASPYPVAYTSVNLNQAPNAPTALSPAGSTTIDLGITQRFSWTFTDPDAGDSQSAFELQYRYGAGAWTTVTGTTPNGFYDFAPSTLPTGSLEWQVRTYDAAGVVGPWSASAFVTVATAPSAPTITAPISGATVGSNSTTTTWSAPSQDAYQVRTVADNAGSPDTSTVYTDTGTVTDASGRSRTVALATNGIYVHIQVRIRVGGLWSSWASVRILVSYTPPATPTLVATPDSSTASISILITDPTPSGSQPSVISHDLYRREGSGDGVRIGAGIGSSFLDYTPASGVAYQYQVVSWGSNGTSTASAWTA